MSFYYVAGLDLAAKQSRCSGYAVLNVRDKVVEVLKCLYADDEILAEVLKLKNAVIALDAPLTPTPRFRDVDMMMVKRGFKVFPPNFKWMRELSIRGYRLATSFLKEGFKVIETHPRSVLKRLGLFSHQELLDLLNVKNFLSTNVVRKDLKDALISACVALCYVLGCYEEVRGRDGTIYLIKLEHL